MASNGDPSTGGSSGLLAGARASTGALLVLGLLVGLAAYLLMPASYTAESRLAVGEQNVSTIQIPGYVEATEDLASNFARYVEDTPSLRDSLPGGGADVEDISASPIPESSVIRVEVTAATESAAVRGVNAVTSQLIDQVGTSDADLTAAQRAFSQAYSAYTAARTTAEATQATLDVLTADPRADPAVLEATRAAADQQAAQAALLDLQQEALGSSYRSAFSDAQTAPTLNSILQATTARADTVSRLQRDLVIGLLAGALLAAANVYRRRRRAQRAVAGQSGVERRSDTRPDDGRRRPADDVPADRGTDGAPLDDEVARRGTSERSTVRSGTE